MIGRTLLRYAQSLKTYTLPREDLRRLQSRRLRRTIELAYEGVPYYHDRLRAIGKTPEDIRSVSDLRLLPVITKKEVVENQRRLRSTRLAARYVRPGSGTSGVPLSLWYDQTFADTSSALMMRRLTVFGVKPWHRVVSVWAPKRYWRRYTSGKSLGEPYSLSDEMGPIAKAAHFSGGFRYLQAADDDPGRDLRELRNLRPDFVLAMASHLVRMAEFIPAKGDGMGVRGINCINEGFTDVTAKKIESAYGGKVLHSYGSNELGNAAAECRFQRGLHLFEDWILYEVLKDGEQVGPGEQGELVGTVFSNRVMPLIRYATGDTVELADEGVCDCGSSMVRVRRMLGRKDDWLMTGDGVPISPFDVAEQVEGRFGLQDYQIVQKGEKEFEVKTADPEGDRGRLEEPLRSYLSERFGAPIVLSFAEKPREDIWLKNRPVVRARS